MTPEPLRVLIADDHPLFRAGMRALLETVPDVEVIGTASSGAEALALAEQTEPDVVLMDLQMPGPSTGSGQALGGLEATRRIIAACPHIAVLVVTMFEDDYSVFTAMRAGARGYVLKDADEEEVLRAIRAVGHGEAIFSPAIARRLVDFFAAPPSAVPPRAFPQLSPREREVLELIAQGVSNAAIAERLCLSPKTVRNHISNIFSKLQVADRAEAIVRAREAGLG
jgi:DNA-binding NarL/FixJ family response regulator